MLNIIYKRALNQWLAKKVFARANSTNQLGLSRSFFLHLLFCVEPFPKLSCFHCLYFTEIQTHARTHALSALIGFVFFWSNFNNGFLAFPRNWLKKKNKKHSWNTIWTVVAFRKIAFNWSLLVHAESVCFQLNYESKIGFFPLEVIDIIEDCKLLKCQTTEDNSLQHN